MELSTFDLATHFTVSPTRMSIPGRQSLSAFLTVVSQAPRTMPSAKKVLKKYLVNEQIYKNHLGYIEIQISGTHYRDSDPEDEFPV